MFLLLSFKVADRDFRAFL